jgi:hypothetical protein
MLTYQSLTGREGRLDCVVSRGFGGGDLTVMAPRQGQYGHGGAQDHTDEHGPRNGPIDPRPLGLHGKICPHLFIRDRCRPAPDHLLEDLCGGGLGVWAEQGGHAPFPLRIAHAHKAHGHRWPLGSRP